MKKLAILLTIIIFSPLTSCKFIREKGWFGGNKADTMVVWQARQDSIRVADSIRAEAARIAKIEQARLDSLRAVEEERLAREARFRYHIVVGSFLTPEYADDYVRHYESLGYDAKMLIDKAERFRLVSAEAHESLGEALRRLSAYQDTVEFEAWIYIRN